MIGLSSGEQAVEVPVREAMRVLAGWRELEEIHHIDETNLEIGEVLPQQHNRRQRLFGGNVPGAGHHHIRFGPLVVAGLSPDADALGAVRDRLVHVQVLQMLLLVADNHVDVVGALQAVIGHTEQAVHIRRQIDAADIRALVHHHVEKAGILMGETIVILAPDGGGNEQVER